MSHTPQLNRKYDNNNHNNDFTEECTAAFICITNNSGEKFKSKIQLTRALQCCGKNPSVRNIENYWDKYSNKNGIGLEEFIEIAKKEEEISEKALVKAFKAIDTNKDDFISLDELYRVLTSKGEKMTKSEVEDILSSADLNKDGKLDYIEFSRLVLGTIDATKDIVKKQVKTLTKKDEPENGKKSRESSRSRSPSVSERSKRPLSAHSNKSSRHGSDEENIREGAGSRISNASRSSLRKHDDLNSSRSKRLNSKDSDSDERSSSKNKKKNNDNIVELSLNAPIKSAEDYQLPKNLKKWKHGNLKGAFYLKHTSNSIFTNSYILNLKEDSEVHFEINPYETSMNKNNNFLKMDILLLIIYENNNKHQKLKAISENKFEDKWCITCKLIAGRYYIYPYTSGAYLKKRDPELEIIKSSSMKTLVIKDSKGRDKLTEKFTDALSTVFDIFDLDSNNRLSKKEFALYMNLAEDMIIDDKEWENFEKSVGGFEKNELTKDKFIQISKPEDEALEDIWKPIFSVGFNKNLELDQCCPYYLSVYTHNAEFSFRSDDIIKLNLFESFLQDYIQTKGKPVNLSNKGLRDLGLSEYHNQYLSLLVIENNKNDEKLINIKDDGCENCLLNHSKNAEVLIKAHKKKIVTVAQAKNINKSWKVRLHVTDESQS